MELFHLDSETFDEVITAHEVPILVDFWATWCGPCQRQAPILEDVATKLGDRAIIAKLNVDESQETALKYGVASIPTMIIFKGGKEVDRMVGVTAADAIIERIKAVE